MEEKRTIALPVFLAALLLLPMLYVGSYFCLLAPFIATGDDGAGQQVVAYRVLRFNAGVDSGLAEAFYSPLYWLDEKLRPSYWNGPGLTHYGLGPPVEIDAADLVVEASMEESGD